MSQYCIYPKYSDTVNVRTPSFFLKRHLFYVPYISVHLPYRVFLLSVNVRTPKTCPLFLIKPSIFHYRNILYICCLPVFPVSVIDKPLYLISAHKYLWLGSIINSIVRKPVVGKFELRMSRPLPHVYRLSRHAQFVSFFVNYIGKYICQAAHMRMIVRTYLDRIFPRKGLSTWCKTNFFF